MERTGSLLGLLGATALVYVVYRRFTRISLADIPGPDPESFLLGNLPHVFHVQREQVGDVDFDWQRRFGGVARIKAPFGEDMLWIADPKALQYVYHVAGYDFAKQPERRVISRLVGDRGIAWADGDAHRRQRRVMLPAFGATEAKALLPVFQGCAERLASKLREALRESPGGACILNIPKWLSAATLDAIGEAAFGYKFGALQDAENELAGAYFNFLADIFTAPSRGRVFFQSVAHYVPMWIQEILYDILPGKGLEKARVNKAVAHKVAERLLEDKARALSVEKTGRDVMSLLVKANASEDAKKRLTKEEMKSLIRTIMLAGQETTSTTLSWALLELAKRPEIQSQLRAEIWAKESAIRDRGDTDFAPPDLDSMPYLQAVLREVLRVYPAVYHNFRQAARDVVLPLSKPLTTVSGKTITEIFVPEDTRVVLSIVGYNRDVDVWGEDAHVFNPQRWMNDQVKDGHSIGVYSNLLTFSGGVRGCIGWRFAIHEMQAFLVELISGFEFSLTDDIQRLRREASSVMLPTLAGETEKGVQLPLKVSAVARE
ncbi:cytochrome P450 [Obba rivulosa]|uniref:Cytochrome P450 n=1 Tax=Obba rivulosa TaxID=1052685 RepID=A0A8E2DJW4_9APHY|nr:cytochrome P450 [Obba rivulosa]